MKFIVSSTALSSHLQAISRVINSKNVLFWVLNSIIIGLKAIVLKKSVFEIYLKS